MPLSIAPGPLWSQEVRIGAVNLAHRERRVELVGGTLDRVDLDRSLRVLDEAEMVRVEDSEGDARLDLAAAAAWVDASISPHRFAMIWRIVCRARASRWR